MKILYLDESGTANAQDQKYFVLASLIVSLEQKKIIENILNDLVQKFPYDIPNDAEIHANVIYSGRSVWRRSDKKVRIEFMKKCLVSVFTTLGHDFYSYSYIEAKNKSHVKFITLATIEHFCELLEKQNEIGFVISDKSSFEIDIQESVIENKMKNLIEPPLFMDSRFSRLVQFADLVAYAVYRHLEKNDDQFYVLCKNLILK
jgi:hypothetical protein